MTHTHHLSHIPVRPSPLGSTGDATPRRPSEMSTAGPAGAVSLSRGRGRTLGRVQQLRVNADAVVKRRTGGVLARG